MIKEIAGALAGQALGMITAKSQDKRQLKQQKKLQDLAMKGSKEMADYNKGIAIEMQDKANQYNTPEEQRKRLEAAGLNAGLMYQGSGAGGTTQTASTNAGQVNTANAAVGGGEAGMAIQLTQQAIMQKAQIDNINANTEYIKEKTNNEKEGIRENLGAMNLDLLAGVKNKEANTELTNTQNKIAKDNAEILNNTKEWQELNIINEAKKSTEEYTLAANKASVDTETLNTQVKQIQANYAYSLTMKKALETGIIKDKTQIKLYEQQIKNLINDAIINNEELDLKKIQTEFNTGTSAEGVRWLNAISNSLQTLTKISK